MVLNDVDTGLPKAILNAAGLTAQRTGAVGALGIKYMTPADLDSVGIIGVGIQGISQATFSCSVRPVREIFFVARSDPTAERFRRVPHERQTNSGILGGA
jgi:ornithine cyclodeaminase/alanine dehydrogenase-like protein (mu-crystallin family)